MKKLLFLFTEAAISMSILNVNAAEITLETVKQLPSSPPCYGYIHYDRTEFEENPVDDVIWHCEARVYGTDFVYVSELKKHGISLLTKITKPYRREMSIFGCNGTTR